MSRERYNRFRDSLFEPRCWDSWDFGRWALEPGVWLPLGEFRALADRLVHWGGSGV